MFNKALRIFVMVLFVMLIVSVLIGCEDPYREEQYIQGPKGSDGKSAFEIYKKYNPEYNGSEEEWINSLKGQQASSEVSVNVGSEELSIIPEYEYNIHMVESLKSEIKALREYIAQIHTPVILDSGACGENLTWALYSDGLLKISGTGRSYDFVKGILIGMTEEEINKYAETTGHTAYAFTEGKTYVQSENTITIDGKEVSVGYVSPWYRYRKETFEEGATSNDYCSKAEYDKWNPNGWTYNRIEIDSGVTYIGDWMFYRAAGPTEIIVPEGVLELGDWAIRYSPTLKCIYLPDSLTKIGLRGCSRNEVATTIRLGSGFTSIGDHAFAQNEKLKYLKVSGDISSIGEWLFEGNASIEYVVFEGMTELKKNTAAVCSNLKKVDLPDTLVTIGYGVFMRTGLETVRIPANVTSIDTNAFYLCEDLKTVYIDSHTIAGGLKSDSDYGRLISYAECVYVKNDITEIGSYLTNAFTRMAEVNGYVLYVRNG